MLSILTVLAILLMAGLTVFYSKLLWGGVACGLFLLLSSFFISMGVAIFLWAIYFLVLLFFCLTPLRVRWFSRPLMEWFLDQQPAISEAEQAVLEAGGQWWETQCFSGQPDWQQLHAIPDTVLTEDEQFFLDHQVNHLCSLLNDWDIVHTQKDLSRPAWDYIKQERFWGLCIPKEYGGLGFSPSAHSAIVSKVATRSISAAYTVMVPNSLGPGKLIQYYGTQDQKDRYLPVLARGEEIPCFALTSIEAGSDAASIPDRGEIIEIDVDGEKALAIRLSWEKRYITLAPVATLIGLAFHLFDPDHLLSDQEDVGITLALISATQPGVEVGRRHAPMTMGFMNGPISGKDVVIPLASVLGGEEGCGRGWSMLMECLTVGRGISMPALASAVGQQCYRMVSGYAHCRRQFHRSIDEFEGVQSALAAIGGWHYLIQATRSLTKEAEEAGVHPAVASAISKYHLTEFSRQLLSKAMDIHAGHGLQMGPRNVLANVYNGLPISTVGEGANIMTRSLILFGQGVLRCHPFLRSDIMTAKQGAKGGNVKPFDRSILSHAGYLMRQVLVGVANGFTGGRCLSVSNARGFKGHYQSLTRLSNALFLCSEATLIVVGKRLKVNEMLSARLGDVLSYLYMASAVLRYDELRGALSSERCLVDWSMNYCLHQIGVALQGFFENFPCQRLAKVMKWTLFPWGLSYPYPSDVCSIAVADAMVHQSVMREELTSECYFVEDSMDPIGRIEVAFQAVLKTQPIVDKVHRAIQGKAVTRQLTRRETYQQAEKKGIITRDEFNALHEMERLRDEAIGVDEFPFDGFN